VSCKSKIEVLRDKLKDIRKRIAEDEPYCYNPQNINNPDFLDKRRDLNNLLMRELELKKQIEYTQSSVKHTVETHTLLLDPRHKQRFS
jgi:hypothetical protein